MHKNNSRENDRRIDYEHQVGNQVTLKADCLKTTQKSRLSSIGPHRAIQAFNNGCAHIQRGCIHETINIRRIDPFFERGSSLD